MTYYLMIESKKIISAGQCPCTTNGVTNCEVTEEVYNKYLDDPKYYIWKNNNVVVNPNYEKEKEQERRAYLSKLAMTKYDFYKYVCVPNEITYTQLMQMVNSSEEIAAAWNLCGHVYRGDETLCDNIATFLPALTSEVLDEIFETYGKVIDE